VGREQVRPYMRLSRIYDAGWPGLSGRYIPLLGRVLKESGSSCATVLDVACGTGTLAVALAREGHVVHGVDLSPEMVAIARRKAAELPDVSFEIGDMRCLSCEATFDLITCTFDSINYLVTVDALRALFAGVARCLAQAGTFVFDSNTDVHYASRSPFVKQREWDNETVEHQLEYDSAAREARVTFRFARGVVEVHRQRPYDLATLQPLLSEAGLSVTEAYSDPEGHEYDAASERVLCVVRWARDCMASN